MKKQIILLQLIVSAVCFQLFFSCGGKGGDNMPPDPCSGVTVSVTGTVTPASAMGASDGSIAAAATGGSGFSFSINGSAFQSSGNFTGLAAGTYTITAKNNNGCSGSSSFTITANDACASVNFTVGGTATTATPCLAIPNGSIIVTTNGGGTGFTYNLNNGAFQSSATFNNLAPGTYTVGAKETGGCIKTASITVNASAPGALFSAVKTIINANCAIPGCHVSPNPTGGHDFTHDCEIVSNATLIKQRAVDNFGTFSQMPPPPSSGLSQADRNAITNWVNAGGRFSD